MKATPEEVSVFRPGMYVHWKGQRYKALGLGQDSTNRVLEGLKWAADWCNRHSGDATLDQTGVERKTLIRVASKLMDEFNIGAPVSSEEPTVAYISLDPGPHQGNLCFRELWQWNERVPMLGGGHLVRRFQWVGP